MQLWQKVINSLIWKLIQIRERTSQKQASTGHVNNVICLWSARSLLEDILNHWLLPLVSALGCPCFGGSESKGQRDSAGPTLPEDSSSSSGKPGWYFERQMLGFWSLKKSQGFTSFHGPLPVQSLALGAGGGSAAVPQHTTGGRRLGRPEEWGSRSALVFGDCGMCGREA